MTLAHQALVLIGLPLIFQLCLGGYLGALIHMIDLERANAAHARNVISRLNTVLAGISSAGIVLAALQRNAGGATLDTAFLESYFSSRERTEAELQTLLALAEHDLPRQQLILKLQEKIKQFFSNLDRIEASLEQNVIPSTESWLSVASSEKELIRSLEMTISMQTELEHNKSVRLSEFEHLLNNSLAIAVAMNFLLVGVLLALFNKATLQGLNTVMQNISRFAASQPLLPAGQATREIIELDAAFRNMASSLTEARHKEKIAVDNAAEVICSLDARGTFLRVNLASKAVWGIGPDQLIGENVTNILVDGDREAMRSSIDAAIRHMKNLQLENKVVSSAGKTLTMLWSLQWSNVDQLLFCVVHDITTEKEAERMQADFVERIRQDLEKPLLAIQSVHSHLSAGDYGSLTEQGKSALATTKSELQRLTSLVNGIIHMRELGCESLLLSPGEADLKEIVDASIRSVAPIAEHKRIRLITSLQHGVSVWADKDKLTQVLINLVANAVKFSPADKSVTISVDDSEDLVVISVCDQGRGVSQDLHSVIFEKYQQAEASDAEHGKGLGLAICKTIVEAHGGEIGVLSKNGQGSRFWFTVPKQQVS